MLVDTEIKKLISEQNVISGVHEESIGPISCDIHINGIISNDHCIRSFELAPMEGCIVEAQEAIDVPDDMTFRVGQKNSLIRLGLYVDAPQYFPGHKTKMYLRVMNFSSKLITLNEGMAIAQLFFEKLDQAPTKTYEDQADASFNNETVYRGYANYKKQYDSISRTVEKAKEDIDGKANQIYANVLTLMGIIAAIFSLVTVNSQYFLNTAVSGKTMIAVNISLVFIVMVMLLTVTCLINKPKNNNYIPCVIGILLVTGILSIIFLFVG